jgi:hypothetical protein
VRGRETVERIASGEALSEGDWAELEEAGMTESEREALRAALAAGDREGAAKAARAVFGGTGVAGASPADSGSWREYERALDSPAWHPRFDRVVRDYFREAGQRGLR